jgi:hypothetical protein
MVSGWVRAQKIQASEFSFGIIFGAFELPSLRNAQKCNKTKSRKKSVFVVDFL